MSRNILFCVLALITFAVSSWAADFGDMLKKFDLEKLQKDQKSIAPVLNLLGDVSEEDEVRIGKQVAGNLLGAVRSVKDPDLQSYVNHVGKWISLQSDRPDLDWHFAVIESDDVNAFAAPGGYIFITKGLYRILSNESELAGVLAHEIGHVVKKHHLKLMQQNQRLDAGNQLLQTQTKDKLIQKLVGSGAEVFARSLDKNAEYEADRMAIVLAARGGYDPYGLTEVLQKIGQISPEQSQVTLLFKTHPLPGDRLLHLGEAVGDRLDALEGKTVEERLYLLKP